jgi:diphthine methyl ester synthase
MVLYIIGLGLSDQEDITIKGLEAVKRCSKIYLESYTSKLNCSIQELEALYKNKIILADRDMVESRADSTILADANNTDVAFLVIGDIFSATTHVDLWMRAKELSIETRFIHNASVITAVGETGLQIYKFGKTTSIAFPTDNWRPETAYDVLKENLTQGLHTLILLDLQPEKDKFMTVNQAIEILLDIEKKRDEKIFTGETLCVGCARLGSDDPTIIYGKAWALLNLIFGDPLHCLIVPGKLHFIEEHILAMRDAEKKQI